MSDERDSRREEAEKTGKKIVSKVESAWETVSGAAAPVLHALSEKIDEVEAVRKARLSVRPEDRNLDAERGVNQERRNALAGPLIATIFVLGLAAGIGFLWTYWTGGNNLWLGGTMAFFLGCFGAGLVLWAHWLTVHKEAEAPREELASPAPEKAAAAANFFGGAQDIQRRRLLVWVGAAGGGMVAAIVVSLLRSLGANPWNALYTTVWKHGQRLVTIDGTPLKVDSLQPGDMAVVFPENAIGSEKTQTVLVKVKWDLLELPEGRSGWAPMGNLAYSRICTHAGCAVGMYEATTHLLMCPCHQSTFDVLDGAKPTGGPAARPLPQLPLYVDGQGFLRAADGFSNPPGPGYWSMPS